MELLGNPAERTLILAALFPGVPPMSVSARLPRQLQEAIGREAADGLLEWMTAMDQHRAELRELNELNATRIDARLGELRADLRLEMAGLRQEMHAADALLRQEMIAGFGRLEALIERTRTDLARTRADLMKWALTFGIGVTGAATGLVLVIERLLG
jgi:hypothetical protein